MLTTSAAVSCGRFTLKELLDFFFNDLVFISVTGRAISYFLNKDLMSENNHYEGILCGTKVWCMEYVLHIKYHNTVG